MSLAKDYADVIKDAEKRGWISTTTSKGHIRLRHEKGGRLVFAPSTPSDYRGLKNLEADLVRVEKSLGLVPSNKPLMKKEERKITMTTKHHADTPHSADPYPYLPTSFEVRAFAVEDGKKIQIVLPDDFVKLNVALAAESLPYRRKLQVALDPAWPLAVQDSVFNTANVFLPAEFLGPLVPQRQSKWQARRIGRDILIGSLLDYLSANYSPPRNGLATEEKPLSVKPASITPELQPEKKESDGMSFTREPRVSIDGEKLRKLIKDKGFDSLSHAGRYFKKSPSYFTRGIIEGRIGGSIFAKLNALENGSIEPEKLQKKLAPSTASPSDFEDAADEAQKAIRLLNSLVDKGFLSLSIKRVTGHVSGTMEIKLTKDLS